ncbi:uncharacterized protein F4807DRAFT_449505 [Annulohypoxylon truncatum]|uniref:uncharacterized protein n=1 Tax=Annulohypoxylon truncatum TaxID=327061 RepID=UPI002007EA51|nr:uncharacterized protein F4807DRAFT_449505 [Annulohypoxylon truncatum]KAI1214166.1 hypothetical protein F4807DRAFT_449505 [Annulohypoxylon truncatum]
MVTTDESWAPTEASSSASDTDALSPVPAVLQEQVEEAIRNENHEELEKLLESDNGVLDVRFQYGLTGYDSHLTLNIAPLALAAALGKTSIVKLLLDHNAEVNAEEPEYGETALHLAARYGPKDTIDLLLFQKPNVNQPGWNGLSPLHSACKYGQTEVAACLLDAQADIGQRDDNGSTPFMIASIEGQDEVLKLLLERGPLRQLNEVNKFLNTPILYSCACGQEQSFDTLFSEGAFPLDVDRQQNTCFHKVVLCDKDFSSGIENILDQLVGAGIDINQTNVFGQSPLFFACKKEKSEHIEYFLHLGADINHIGPVDGSTVLMQACCQSDSKLVRMLLQQGADTTVTNKHGLASLALACRFGQLENAQALISEGAAVNVHDRNGLTPLDTAVIYDNFDIALEIMATPSYFPENPAGEKAFAECSTRKDRAQAIEGKLLANFEAGGCEEQERIPVILHWAIANGASNLVKWCISNDPSVLQWNRNGATWLHTVEVLLQMILEQSLKVDAIMDQNSQGESPLTISINRRNKKLEDLFWDHIRQLGTTNEKFMESDQAKAERILEVVAMYETPGHEVTLRELLKKWFSKEDAEDKPDFTPLHWAVVHSQAVVVWWLLSKGGYSNHLIESALKVLPDRIEKDSVQDRIRALLHDPPPIRIKVANPNNYPITPQPTPRNGNNPALGAKGNIVDVFSNGETLSIPHVISNVEDIVYGKGPESLMKEARENLDKRNLEALKRSLKEKHQYRSVDSLPPQLSGPESSLKLRWIHLSVNDDLVCRLSHDSGRLEMDHVVLMKHLTRSWTELAAGGKRNYMKPQCVRKEIDHIDAPDDNLSGSRPAGERITYTTLYMPYLTIGHHTPQPKTSTANSNEKESTYDHNLEQIKHRPMTLDQYYYPTIEDTNERDGDQVLSKFLHEEHTKTILMVNQLWIWITDDKTIITATTDDSGDESAQNLLQTTLKNVLYGETRSRFERATSVQAVMELVVGAATGSFMEKSIPTGPVGKELSTKKGPIEIFRESIRRVADGETSLFRDFLASLRSKAWRRNKKSNRYHIISDETELLDHTRDIRDELHILRSLAEDQDTVWKQAFPTDDLTDHFLNYHSCTPTDVKKNLDEMLLEADKTTDYINTLLDLRQAEYSRIQSNCVLIFTIVTIVFLPLSFLSALFALNVSSFPHESGTLQYEGWWLFPIMFGVTALVSTPAIIFAWNTNALSDWFGLRSKYRQTEGSSTTDEGNGALTRRSTIGAFGRSLKRRPQKHKEDVSPA